MMPTERGKKESDSMDKTRFFPPVVPIEEGQSVDLKPHARSLSQQVIVDEAKSFSGKQESPHQHLMRASHDQRRSFHIACFVSETQNLSNARVSVTAT